MLPKINKTSFTLSPLGENAVGTPATDPLHGGAMRLSSGCIVGYDHDGSCGGPKFERDSYCSGVIRVLACAGDISSAVAHPFVIVIDGRENNRQPREKFIPVFSHELQRVVVAGQDGIEADALVSLADQLFELREIVLRRGYPLHVHEGDIGLNLEVRTAENIVYPAQHIIRPGVATVERVEDEDLFCFLPSSAGTNC